MDATWDVNWDANWDVKWDANWEANKDANWDANQDDNQHPKQHQLLKGDVNNTIKNAIPCKSVHFVQKMMKNTLKVMVDAKSNHRVFLQWLYALMHAMMALVGS